MITTIIATIIFVSYVSLCCWKYGIPETLSDTFYKVGSLFSIIIWIVGSLILPDIIDQTGSDIKLIPFLIVAGLVFVGAAPHFKSYERCVHIAGASIAGISSQLWIILYNHPLLLLGWLLLLPFIKKKEIIFYAEMICMGMIIIGLLI